MKRISTNLVAAIATHVVTLEKYAEMNKYLVKGFRPITFSLALTISILFFASAQASAQCSELASGLHIPLGITQSNLNNLLVSETGTPALHTGRISIVEANGNRRTLLDGLPSGINDVNEPSGPAGLFMRGRTLYVAIGIGDAIIAGPLPGTALPNPVGPSSPIFSAVLAIHFSANVEQRTDGFTLSGAHQHALAAGQRVRLKNDQGDKITIELVANFPDYTPNPLPFFEANVRGSNPFDLVAVGNQLFVTDGGQNSVRQVDLLTGDFSTLVIFPVIPNPLPFGPPVIEAVPTGIRYADDQLLVALFRGFPFVPGTSVVEQVDPQTGAHAPFITGLSSAIDVLLVRSKGDTNHLVLQFSTDMLAGALGSLLRFETPAGPPTTVAGCLITPTSMTLDEKTGTLYITELGTGRLVAISLL